MNTTRKYITNTNVFTDETANSFYLLGAYMTDGEVCVNHRRQKFRISSKDQDWLESIRDVISPGRPIYNYVNHGVLEIFGTECLDWLISYGCVPRKSKILEIAKPIPKEYIRDFIRGAIDGDGSISQSIYVMHKNGKNYYHRKQTVYLCSASGKFIEQIANLIPTEIKFCLKQFKPKPTSIKGREVRTTCDFYRLTFSEKYSRMLLNWLYYPGCKLYLPRKKLLAEIICNTEVLKTTEEEYLSQKARKNKL